MRASLLLEFPFRFYAFPFVRWFVLFLLHCVTSPPFQFCTRFIFFLRHFTLILLLLLSHRRYSLRGSADSLSFIYLFCLFLLGIISLEPSVHALHPPVRYCVAIVGVYECKMYESRHATVPFERPYVVVCECEDKKSNFSRIDYYLKRQQREKEIADEFKIVFKIYVK